MLQPARLVGVNRQTTASLEPLGRACARARVRPCARARACARTRARAHACARTRARAHGRTGARARTRACAPTPNGSNDAVVYPFTPTNLAGWSKRVSQHLVVDFAGSPGQQAAAGRASNFRCISTQKPERIALARTPARACVGEIRGKHVEFRGIFGRAPRPERRIAFWYAARGRGRGIRFPHLFALPRSTNTFWPKGWQPLASKPPQAAPASALAD